MRELSPEHINEMAARVEIVEAIDAAVSQRSQLLELADTSETVDDFRFAIQSWLGCSPIAARSVGELQLRRMARAERQKIADELGQLRAELAEHRGERDPASSRTSAEEGLAQDAPLARDWWLNP